MQPVSTYIHSSTQISAVQLAQTPLQQNFLGAQVTYSDTVFGLQLGPKAVGWKWTSTNEHARQSKIQSPESRVCTNPSEG